MLRLLNVKIFINPFSCRNRSVLVIPLNKQLVSCMVSLPLSSLFRKLLQFCLQDNLLWILQSLGWSNRRINWFIGRSRFSAAVGDFYLLHSIQTGFVAHPASYAMTRGRGVGVMWLRCEAGHSLCSSAEVKNGRAAPLVLHTSSEHVA
jgi:hypothetical protein